MYEGSKADQCFFSRWYLNAALFTTELHQTMLGALEVIIINHTGNNHRLLGLSHHVFHGSIMTGKIMELLFVCV